MIAARLDGRHKSERGPDSGPFQQYPIHPVPSRIWDLTTTPGTPKTTCPATVQTMCQILYNPCNTINIQNYKQITRMEGFPRMGVGDHLYNFLEILYILLENSGADGGADGGRQNFGPLRHIFGVLGLDHDARFRLGARVTHDHPAGCAQ